ncbi:SDR family oxidoreductase [Tsukamurella sp. DT100]|uniref:SDR family oxidoreductase n=1 Tax=Tsukamurella sp. DT100 TaxID=3393415 RepID=UPI003CEA2734
MTFELRARTVVLIGGASGIGLAVARRVIADGARVVLGGRSRERLDGAVAALGPAATGRTVDTADPDGVEAFFARVESVDALFTTAATYTVGSFVELDVEEARSPFESKFWGQYRMVKAALPALTADAAVVLTSGAASVRPAGPAAPYVAVNAAIEGLARGLAVELAPVRVNAIAPGTVDGNLWAGRPREAREAAFAHIEREAVLGRPGTEDEIAAAVVHLFTSTYTTGSTLYVDGGYALR